MPESVLLITGFLVGAFINFAIYQFAYFPRPVSPWQRKDCTLFERLPVLGWLTRSRHRSELGNWFWLRPMLIEALLPVGLIALWRRVTHGQLVPSVDTLLDPAISATLVPNFFCLAILFTLLVIATFIDFDERTIPDFITVPGTCIALLGSAFVPQWRLLEIDQQLLQEGALSLRSLHANSPFDWPLNWQQGNFFSLGIALFFWLGWCFALLNRQWITRRGWGKAWEYFWAILKRDPWTRFVGAIAISGSLCITVAYFTMSAQSWESLLSSLFGIGLGGMLLWSFRLVAALVMGKEALGFGDVTLMAMVGGFVGWQVVWMAFFLSPFFAILFVIVLFLLTRDASTPFGPYLSMAVIYVIWDWAGIWNVASMFFLPPGLLIWFWAFLLVALALMLGLIEFVKMGRSKKPQQG